MLAQAARRRSNDRLLVRDASAALTLPMVPPCPARCPVRVLRGTPTTGRPNSPGLYERPCRRCPALPGKGPTRQAFNRRGSLHGLLSLGRPNALLIASQ